MRRKELQPIRAGRHRSKFSLRKKQSATDPLPRSCGQYGSAANTALKSDAKSIENVVALVLVHCWVRGRRGLARNPYCFSSVSPVLSVVKPFSGRSNGNRITSRIVCE